MKPKLITVTIGVMKNHSWIIRMEITFERSVPQPEVCSAEDPKNKSFNYKKKEYSMKAD